MDIEEITIDQGAQWRLEDLRIGIVRVGEHEGSDAAELLVRSDAEARHALITTSGRDADVGGWRISLLSAIRPEDRSRCETVRLRAVRGAAGAGP